MNENKLVDFLIGVSFHNDKHRRPAIVQKCFEIFQFVLYNIKDNQRGNLGTILSLVSLLSNKSISKMLRHRYDLSDGETMDYWINNFKTLVGKVKEDHAYLPLFLNSRDDYLCFPLLSRPVAYFNCHSSMVRTTISLFVLDFIAIANKNEQLSRYISYFPFANYYVLNVLYIHDIHQDIKAKMVRKE